MGAHRSVPNLDIIAFFTINGKASRNCVSDTCLDTGALCPAKGIGSSATTGVRTGVAITGADAIVSCVCA